MLIKRLFFVPACMYIFTVPGLAAQPRQADRPVDMWPQCRVRYANDIISMAQNSADDNVENNADATEDQKVEQKKVPAARQQAPASGAKTDPLTTFEPSEKVPADQTVDFPYDI